MSAVFNLEKNETLFGQLVSDGKLFTFEKFLPGIADVDIGTRVTIVFSGKKVDAKVVKIMPPHPSFKTCGRRVEIIVC